MATDDQFMTAEEHEVSVLLATGSMRAAHITVREQADGASLQVSLVYGDRRLARTGPECWSALCALRSELEQEGVRLVCYGASKNVHPSGMSRDMGIGEYAYRLEIGHAARTKDVVSIFATGADVVPVTLAEQQEYYDTWLQSLKT